MGDGTKKKPYTRKDVLRLIKENGGTAKGLDLSRKVFKDGIKLRGLNLEGIILKEAILWDIASEDPEMEDPTARLEGAHLEGTSLMDAHLEGAHILGSHLEGADLFNAHLEEALLTEVHLEEACLHIAHLEGAKLRFAHLEGSYLAGVRLSSETNLENVYWGDYILGEESKGLFDIVSDTYRQLKMWHANAGLHDIAAKFYYREMEAKRKAQNWTKKPHLKLWSWVMRLLCGYGEKPERVVVSALVVVFGLAVVYLFGGLNLAYSIYFSAVSFTALGYGGWVDIIPRGWVQALGATESFLGVFMMALFLVTFIRKMTR